MARWQPNAADRLALAALELFAQRGYENTTVAQIAELAGLTKSTFFRYFRDKREVLFGPETMTQLLVDGIASAPGPAGPIDALAHAFDLAGKELFTTERREFSRRRRAVIEANPDLQEREALKGLVLTAAMANALHGRDVPELTSSVTAHLGALAFDLAYERWTSLPAQDQPSEGEFGPIARQALADVLTASPRR